MIRDIVAKRYAQAAFEIARGRNSLEEWATDLALVAVVMADPQAVAILSSTSRPMPGRLNTFSTITAPASRKANCRPMTVVTGISALRSTWRHITAPGASPLARAVRT